MKKNFLTFIFIFFFINYATSSEKLTSSEKASLIKKFGSIGYGAKKLDYNFGCFIDRESYDEKTYNRHVKMLGPYAFGYKMYNHPEGQLMLFNNWSQDNLFYDLPITTTYMNRDKNLSLMSPVIKKNNYLVLNFLKFEPDKVMLYRTSYNLSVPIGNQFLERYNNYLELLQSSNDDAIKVLQNLQFDMLKYITKNPKKESQIIYSCNQW